MTPKEATEPPPDAPQLSEPWRTRWRDYYTVLGVDRRASSDAIRRAHEEKARQLDPQSYADAPAAVRERAQEEFELLEQAIRVLGDDGLRALYDEEFDRLVAFRTPAGAPTGALAGPPPAAPAPGQDGPGTTFAPEASIERIQVVRTELQRSRPRVDGPLAVPWGLPAVLLALSLPVFLWAASFTVGASEQQDLTQSEIVTVLIFTIAFDAVLIAIAAGVAIWRHNLGWPSLGLRSLDLRLWWLPLAAAAGAHVAVIVYSMILIAIGGEGAVPEQEDLNQLFENRAILPLAGLATVIAAPLAEEIFFRGLIFPGLVRPFGLPGAMAVSGLVFGAFHVSGPETIGLVVPFAAIGALFAWIYYRTGSLWPSIATHLLFNLVSFIALASTVGNGST